MIKPILKTLSFSFATFALATIAAAGQGPVTDRAAASSDSARVGCATVTEIDLGWEEQIQQVEKREAEKEADGLLAPGAIITPPFETFAPYRTDLPPVATAARGAKSARPQSSHD
jgi:ABC-type sugar transport system substrate-binding protein